MAAEIEMACADSVWGVCAAHCAHAWNLQGGKSALLPMGPAWRRADAANGCEIDFAKNTNTSTKYV
jgi:hypothetical protein